HLPSSIHLFSFFLHSLCHPPVLHSFPTRRSSDLLFQMRFYALAIWRAQGRVPSMLQLIYLGNGEIVRYQPDEADLLATERKVERSEEHTSELQSLTNLVCRLLLEKKKHHESTNTN